MSDRNSFNPNYAKVFDRIIGNVDLSQVLMLKEMFDHVTASYIGQVEREIELLRAMGADEMVVTEQIKAGTMNAARDMFEFCYRSLTGERGRSVWDE